MRQKYPREEFEYWDSKPTKRRKRKARAADGLYDMPGAAQRLNTTTDKVRAFVTSGQLKFINIGLGQKRPRYRFSETDLQELISKLTSQESAPCPSSRLKRASPTPGSTSKSVVVGFMALRAAQIAKTLKK